MKTKLRHTSAKESRKWLGGPHMGYWPQQLNFAVFCATQGCGVSREIFDSGLDLPPQIRAFYWFHVYFTVRRILYEMGGIQNKSALPDDPVFKQQDNPYDVASYKRLCYEFGIDPSSDFRFTHGANHGLGSVYIWVSNVGPVKTGTAWPGGFNKFSDEGGAGSKGNLIQYIEPDDAAYSQYDWFAPNTASGLTKAGLARINESIEAYVFRVLGAQVNIRSSILDKFGKGTIAQNEFIDLVKDALKLTDKAQAVVDYQRTVDAAKVRLNLAVAPGAWLMPAMMILNTESVVGYNNNLKQAAPGMKLGVNNEVNLGTKKAALQHMEGGKSKVNQANSRPTNPFHKAATQQVTKKTETTPSDETQPTPQETEPTAPQQHEINKTVVIVGAVGVAALLFFAWR